MKDLDIIESGKFIFFDIRKKMTEETDPIIGANNGTTGTRRKIPNI